MEDFFTNTEGKFINEILSNIVPLIIGIIVFLLARKRKAEAMSKKQQSAEEPSVNETPGFSVRVPHEKGYKPIEPR